MAVTKTDMKNAANTSQLIIGGSNEPVEILENLGNSKRQAIRIGHPTRPNGMVIRMERGKLLSDDGSLDAQLNHPDTHIIPATENP